jgi:hypothetical protein
MGNRKRIAICLFGQTRTLRVIKRVYSSLNIDNCDIDLFISSWDDFYDKTSFVNFTDTEFLKPHERQYINNTEKAAYTIYRVNNIKTSYEIWNDFTYDHVMWTRSEILYDKNTLEEYFGSKILKQTNEIDLLSNIKKDENGNVYLDADYSFFGPSHIFDIYATGWKSIFKAQKLPLTHGGHNYHAEVITQNNINVNQIKLHHSFQYGKLEKRELNE